MLACKEISIVGCLQENKGDTSKPTTCNECKLGLYITEDEKGELTLCTECTEGFYLKDDKNNNKKLCKPCQSLIDKCTKCLDGPSPKCFQCSLNYKLAELNPDDSFPKCVKSCPMGYWESAGQFFWFGN